MKVQVLKRTDRDTAEECYLVDRAATTQLQLTWSPDLRFAQVCGEEINVWEVENDDRRAKIYHFSYEKVMAEVPLYFIVSLDAGWLFDTSETPGVQKNLVCSTTKCSIISGDDYENMQSSFNQYQWEYAVKTRIFPFG